MATQACMAYHICVEKELEESIPPTQETLKWELFSLGKIGTYAHLNPSQGGVYLYKTLPPQTQPYPPGF